MRSHEGKKTSRVSVCLSLNKQIELFIDFRSIVPLLGIRAYKCSFCTSDFLDNRTLKKHTLKVHGRETKGGICKELSSKIAAMGGPVRVVNMD